MRYRLRTALREHLPAAIARRIPKGAKDCGDHEWHVADEQAWHCYHCTGATHVSPWDAQALATRRTSKAKALRAQKDGCDAPTSR